MIEHNFPVQMSRVQGMGPADAAMAAPDVDAAIGDAWDIAPLPAIVMELIASLDREQINSHELAHKLGNDQALTAKTLRLANSSFYGRSNQVATIDQAIAILGYNSIRTLVTTSAVVAHFPEKRCNGFNHPDFWRHCIGAALWARNLARHVGYNEDHAFMAGILHDIGRLVLVSRWPKRYQAVLARHVASGQPLPEAEHIEFGMDHAAAGALLMRRWKFPEFFEEAIAGHHDTAPRDKDIGCLLLQVSDRAAHCLPATSGFPQNGLGDCPIALDALGLNQADLAEMHRVIAPVYIEACEILLAKEVHHEHQ